MSAQNQPSTTHSGQTSRTDPAEDRRQRELSDTHGEANSRYFTHMITVLSVSSGMVGVCLTAIGLIGVMKSISRVETVVDDLLAISAVMFMAAAVLSFLGLRTRLTLTWRNFARVLDGLFCLALTLVVIATMLLTWMVW